VGFIRIAPNLFQTKNMSKSRTNITIRLPWNPKAQRMPSAKLPLPIFLIASIKPNNKDFFK